MKRVYQYLVGLLILFIGVDCGALYAQKSALVRANAMLTENPRKAVLILDSVVRHAETKTLSVSWTLRGRAYFELCRVQNYSTKNELLEVKPLGPNQVNEVTALLVFKLSVLDCPEHMRPEFVGVTRQIIPQLVCPAPGAPELV